MKNYKTVGTVCEYNPFHYGHSYNFNKAKKDLNADYTVCVMSGSFVQRGDVAIFDKWARAKCAVLNGADLVVELPCYYVLQSAKNFAYGAIKLLDSIGVDFLTFGSENGNLDYIKKVADILYNEPKEFKDELKKLLDSGMGYPYAMENAIKRIMGTDFSLNPNDSLGINYLNALKELKSDIIPYTVKRVNNYHLTDAEGEFASATAIRNMIAENIDSSKYAPVICEPTYSLNNIEALILGHLRILPGDKDFSGISGMENGLDIRIMECAKKSTSLKEFFKMLSCKRYTDHRLRRAVLCLILGIENGYKMDYIRPLAFNKNGAKILKDIKESCSLKIISKTADFDLKPDSMLNLDIKSTDLASLCCNDKKKRYAGKDYSISPVFIGE